MEISEEEYEKLCLDQISMIVYIQEDIRRSVLRAMLKNIPLEIIAITIVNALNNPVDAEILAELIDKNKKEVWN